MAPVFGEEDLSFSWKKITLIVSLLALLAAAAAMWQIRRINEFETVIILATNERSPHEKFIFNENHYINTFLKS